MWSFRILSSWDACGYIHSPFRSSPRNALKVLTRWLTFCNDWNVDDLLSSLLFDNLESEILLSDINSCAEVSINMSNSVKLAFSILDHLSRCLEDSSGEKAETLEVAIQCLEQVFEVENYDENQKEALKVDKSLQEIFDSYDKGHTSKTTSVMQPTAQDREKAEELKKEGNDLMRMEKFQEAINCYTQAIALDNTNPVYPCNRAAAYSKLSEHEKAVDDCKRALKLDPKYSKAYGRMGLSYQNMNDLQKAQESYKKAIELEPDNAFYKKSLGEIQEALGQTRGPLPNTGPGLSSVGSMDFASLLSNPAIMNMAQNFMTSPQMQHMMSSMMTGGGGAPGSGGGMGGGGGGMGQLFQAAQRFGEQLQETNPDLMDQLRAQAQETFHRDPDSNPFNARDSNKQPDGDDKKE